MRLRGNDLTEVGAVIPAKVGIHGEWRRVKSSTDHGSGGPNVKP